MINVLLVDDESYVTESIEKTIAWAELGVETVYQAISAVEALRIIEEQDIDILVTDIKMPEMTGLELIERVKEDYPNIRSILLTGYSDFEYAKQAIKLKANDYLLKPVDDELFMKSLSEQIEQLQEEWKRVEELHQLMYARNSNYSLLQRQFMHDLLLGRAYSQRTITTKLAQYGIKLAFGQSAILLTVQLAGRFIDMDQESKALIEYAVGNIAEEIFHDPYRVWHSSTAHDCVVIVIALPEKLKDHSIELFAIHQLCEQFQKQVSEYLNGGISIVMSQDFTFPGNINIVYRESLSALYRIGLHETKLISLEANTKLEQRLSDAIEHLYRPPTFIHLLETGQWQSAKEKLSSLFHADELIHHTRESVYEAFIAIYNGIIYVAHKKGIDLREIDLQGLNLLYDRAPISSASNLKGWSDEVIDKLQLHYDESDTYQKKHVIKQVQDLVSKELGIDTSVKTIADRVYLHPVYLSKLYKSETGESLGDFIIRMRMEKAVYMLRSTNKKIYEITTELGYQNPQYFSKIFKKHYGCTPNEYRDQ